MQYTTLHTTLPKQVKDEMQEKWRYQVYLETDHYNGGGDRVHL